MALPECDGYSLFVRRTQPVISGAGIEVESREHSIRAAFEVLPKSVLRSKPCARCPAGVREVSFSKRCVVAYELCGVASVYRQPPKEVLLVAFQKSRRAARTDKLLRMSRRLGPVRLARVKSTSVQNCVRSGCVEALQLSEASMASKRSGQWRQLSDCVSGVLRDVRVVSEPVVVRPAASQLN